MSGVQLSSSLVQTGGLENTDRLIEVGPGRLARLEFACDITDNEQERQRIRTKSMIDETLLKCIKTLNKHRDIKNAINDLLSVIAKFYHGSRAYIFEIDKENAIIHNTYE